VFYTYMAGLQEWLGRRKKKPVSQVTPAETPA